MLQELAKFAIGTGTISWVIIYLARRFGDQLFAKNLEVHKAALTRANQVSLERLRAELGNESQRLGILRSRIQDKVVDTLELLYGTLLAINDSTIEFLNQQNAEMDPMRDDAFERLQRDISSFDEVFRPRRIYLASDLSNSIHDYVHTVQRNTRRYYVFRERSRGDTPMYSEELDKAFEKHLAKAQPMLNAITDAFREALGVLPPAAPRSDT